MKNKMISIMLTVIMAGLLLSGCGKPEAEPKDVDVEIPGFAPAWTKDAVLYEVNVRQYSASSSFSAVEDRLEALWDMGVNTLWFMPIFPISKTNRSGTLGSYYSVDDYCAVNPEFGTLDDFKRLVDKAHAMGFHIILDWVANHTGWDNAWIKDHPDWYTQKNGKIISPEGFNWPDVADLNYDNQEMRKAMIDAMAYWVSEFDIDGFRCDYAGGVPADFWAQARTELEKIKPVFFLEEELGGQNQKLLEEAFDCNYAAKFYDTLVLVASGAKSADKLKLYLQKMPENDFAMFYLDNHDLNSYDRTIVEGFSEEKLPEMFSLIFTMPGVPMLYSGNEIGYNKRLAFMEKDPISWSAVTTDYSPLIKVLSGIKKSHPALYAGRFGGELEYLDFSNQNIYAFQRQVEGDSVICVYNLSKREQTGIDWQAAGISGDYKVILKGAGGEWTADPTDQTLPETLVPWEFFILQKQ